LTDGIATEGSPRKRKKEALAADRFKADELIRSFAEAQLVESYFDLLTQEESEFRKLELVLEGIPVYDEYLTLIRGCGPAMSGVLIAEMDPHKARSVSSFWKYAGLDVAPAQRRDKAGKVTPWERSDPRPFVEEAGENAPRWLGRSRTRDHLVKRKYVDRDGVEQERDSVTFNPWLKTKLYVLATNLLRAGGPYADIYRGYKGRLESSPRWQLTTKGHRHNAAMRYMLKMFLQHLWEKWRLLEGLAIKGSYAEDKLGIHHGAAVGKVGEVNQ